MDEPAEMLPGENSRELKIEDKKLAVETNGHKEGEEEEKEEIHHQEL